MGSIGGKKEEPKIGSIQLTLKERMAIRNIIDGPDWPAFEKWFRLRQTNIAVTGMTAARDTEDMYFYKGMSHESRQTVLMLRAIRDKLHQADSDTEGKS